MQSFGLQTGEAGGEMKPLFPIGFVLAVALSVTDTTRTSGQVTPSVNPPNQSVIVVGCVSASTTNSDSFTRSSFPTNPGTTTTAALSSSGVVSPTPGASPSVTPGSPA